MFTAECKNHQNVLKSSKHIKENKLCLHLGNVREKPKSALSTAEAEIVVTGC